MRRLLVVLAILVGLLVVADRVAVAAADHVVAARLQTQEGLTTRPSVSIGGFPFLTQALSGRYDDVEVTVHDLHRTAVRVDTLQVRLHGVHVPLSAVFSQHLSRVAIDSGTATVTLTYGDLNAYLSRAGLTVAAAGGGAVRATGTIEVGGVRVAAGGTVALSMAGTDLRLAVGSAGSVTVPLGGLPFAVHLSSPRATARGIVVSGSAEGLVVRGPG